MDDPELTLVGVKEIAPLFGLSRQRVDQMRLTDTFPKPVKEGPRHKRLFDRAAVLAWRDQQLQGPRREWMVNHAAKAGPPPPPPPEARTLVHSGEIAELFGVGRSRVSQMTLMPTFPRPVKRASGRTRAYLYDLDKVLEWHKLYEESPRGAMKRPLKRKRVSRDKCARCGDPLRGSAAVDGVLLCFGEGPPECYEEVTVFGLPLADGRVYTWGKGWA